MPGIYAEKVHAPYAARRARTIAALLVTNNPAQQKRARKLEACCESPQVFENTATGELTIYEKRCRSRLCPRCGEKRAQELRSKLLPLTQQMDSPRFLTLTLRSSDAPLDVQLRRMLTCFGKLRRSKLWKGTFRGGWYVVEITWNVKRRQWHPHLHAVVDGVYIDVRKLADAWEAATGDSRIIDLRKVNSHREVIAYVTNYVTKSQDCSHVPDWKIPEWASNLQGLRMVSTFGTMHAAQRALTAEEPLPESEYVIHLEPLLADALDGNPIAQQLADDLAAARRALFSAHHPDEIADAQARHREVARGLRTWRLNRENPNHADAPPEPVHPHARDRPADRTIGLWKDEAGAIAH